MKKYLFIFTIIIATQIANAQFGGGDGTENNPYQIATKKHLYALADSVNNSAPYPAPYPAPNWSAGKYFKLMNHITDPITEVIGYDINNQFQGNFDGQDHAIALAINMPTADYVGLFGCIQNATIKNVIVNGYVNGNNIVSGIAGFILNNAAITDCVNAANITGNVYVAGIVALACYNTTIENCINSGDITGSNLVAGIAGSIGETPPIDILITINNYKKKGIIKENADGFTGVNILQSEGKEITYPINKEVIEELNNSSIESDE